MFGHLTNKTNNNNINNNKSAATANNNNNFLGDELATMQQNCSIDANRSQISAYFGDAESTKVPSSMKWSHRRAAPTERFYLGDDDDSDVDGEGDDDEDGANSVYGFGSSPDSWDAQSLRGANTTTAALAATAPANALSGVNAGHSSSSTSSLSSSTVSDGRRPITVDGGAAGRRGYISSSSDEIEMMLEDGENRDDDDDDDSSRDNSTCFMMDEYGSHYEKTVKEVKKKLSNTSLGFVLDEDSGLGGSAPNSATESEEAESGGGAANADGLNDRPTQLVPLRVRHAAAAAPSPAKATPTNAPKKSSENRVRKSTWKAQFYDCYQLADDHLGAGAYACVRTCVSRASGREYAVKLVDKREPGHTRSRIFREVEIFKLCKSHPNIVQLIEWFEDDIFFYMVFEKMHGGPLLDHIQRKVCFTEQEASQVTRDIANALKYLHDRGIAHRDVKPENILCTERDHVSPVKLCDLDLASKPSANAHQYHNIYHPNSAKHGGGNNNNNYSPQYSSQQMKAHQHQQALLFNDSNNSSPSFAANGGGGAYLASAPRNLPTVASEPDLASPVGSAEFMAPEVVDAFVGESLKYDKRCDMWSLGVIVYIMLCGYPPFYGECERDNCGWDQGEACSDCQDSLFHRIQVGEFNFPEEEWDNISAEAKDLISHLLVRNVRQRYTADDVLMHAWVAEGAPKTPLQTPSNLFRNDSARDMHQMNQVFQVYQHLNQPTFEASCV